MNYHELVLPTDIASCCGTKDIAVFHLNTRSVKNKVDDIVTLFEMCKVTFDVIMFSETWCQSDQDMLILPGYNNFSLNRSERRGGGVSIMVNREFQCEKLLSFTEITENYEILSLKCENKLFSVVYRPPSTDFGKFFSFLDTYLEFASANNLSVIIGGDFNVNMQENSSLSQQLNNIITSYGFLNVITSPTRTTDSSKSVIDLFVTNETTQVNSAGTICSDISDHTPIFISFRDSNTKAKVKRNVFSFQYISDQSLLSFRNEIASIDWTPVTLQANIDDSYDKFLSILKKVYNRWFPYKTTSASKKIRKPWVTPLHLKKITHKNRLYKNFVTTRDPSKLIVFKKYRNALTSELKKAKHDYYKALFSECAKKRPDVVWKSINEILQPGRQHNFLGELQVNGKLLSGTSLAECFNSHFVNLASSSYCEDAVEGIYQRVSETLFLDPTSEHEVFRVFMGLKNSKTCDIDDLQIKPIKFVLDIITPCLVHIFNLCLSCGKFPQKMKLAKVSVIYKGGDKNVLSNYRPISVLPVFSKGLEKIIFCRLNSFLCKHSVITESQFGFRKGRSTESALLLQKEIILQNIESKLLTLGIFIDFSKAFDCLNHGILIDKLSRYGIRGPSLSLLYSYLYERRQSVIIDGHFSSLLQIKYGVPQGSILGPLLFNIYINDLVNISENVKFVLYADDTSLFLSDADADNLITKGNLILSRFFLWSRINGLYINDTKTKAILFKPSNKQVNINETLHFQSTPIELVKEHKTLGIIFSDNLQWDKHINQVVSKLCKIVGVLARCRAILPEKIKLQIYHALFKSQISYCHLVWGTTTRTNLNRILLLQKKVLRFVGNVHFLAHTEALFSRYKIINIHRFYEYLLTRSFLFSSPESINFLKQTSGLIKNIPTICTRYSEEWKVFPFRTNYSYQSLKHNLPSLLNKYCVDDVDIYNINPKSLYLLFV